MIQRLQVYRCLRVLRTATVLQLLFRRNILKLYKLWRWVTSCFFFFSSQNLLCRLKWACSSPSVILSITSRKYAPQQIYISNIYKSINTNWCSPIVFEINIGCPLSSYGLVIKDIFFSIFVFYLKTSKHLILALFSFI